MFKKKYREQIVLVGIIVLYYSIFYAFLYPMVYSVRGGSDEFLTLASSTLLNNQDWSMITSKFSNYYGYGYTLFFGPLFTFIKSPVIRYIVLHIMNAVLHTIVGLISFLTLERFLKVKNKKYIFLLSLAVGLFYFEGISGTAIVNELPLFVMMMINLLLLLYAFKYKDDSRKKITCTVLLAVSCIYSLTIHTRAIFCIGGICVVIVGCLFYFHKSIVNIPIFMLLIAYFYLKMNFVTARIQEVLYNGRIPTNNTVEGAFGSDGGVFTKFSLLLSREGLYGFGVACIGRLFIIFTSSGGLFCIGVLVATRILLPRVLGGKNRNSVVEAVEEIEMEQWNNMRIISIYLLSMIVASMLLFNLHCVGRILETAKEQKINKWMFYTRYHMMYFVPLLLLIYPYYERYKKNIRVINIGSVIIYFAIILGACKWILPLLTNNEQYITKVMFYQALPFTFKSPYSFIGSEFFWMNFLVGGLLLIVHMAFLNRKQCVSLVLSIFVSIFIFAYLMILIYIPDSKEIYKKTDDIYATVITASDNFDVPETIYCVNFNNFLLENIQYSLCEYRITDNLKNMDEEDSIFLLSSEAIDTAELTDRVLYPIMLDEEEYLYVSDENIYKYIQANN